MSKIIMLLDVDDTLIIYNMYQRQRFYWNDALIEALLAENLNEVYLFTAYNVSGVPKTHDEESTFRPSRLRLKEYLESKGLKVLGIITILDPTYGKGIGKYYEERILPFEMMSHMEGGAIDLKQYQQSFEEDWRLKQKMSKAGKLLNPKAAMYEYLIDQLPIDETVMIVFIDDKKAYLDQVQEKNRQLATPRNLITIETARTVEYTTQTGVQEKKLQFNKTSADYQEELSVLFLQSADEPEQQLMNALIALSEPYNPDQPQAEVYGALDEPIYFSVETTRQILSLDESFKPKKQNRSGNSHVTKMGELFFKYPIERPLEEQAVHQLDHLLGGGLTAPSRLLFIKLNRIPEFLQNLDAKGLSSTTVGIQANLAIEGIDLEHFVSIPRAFNVFQELLGKEIWFAEGLKILEDGFWKNAENEALDLETMIRRWIEFFNTVTTESSNGFPQDFKEYDQLSDEKKRSRIETMMESYRPQDIAQVFALFQRYPGLMTPDMTIGDLIQDLNALKELKKLYPNYSMEQLAEKILTLFDLIDINQWSRHFFLELLTNPGDHKPDNFIGQIIRYKDGSVATIKIIGIDNDNVFVNPIVKVDENKHVIWTRTVIYAFQNCLTQPIPADVRALLLSKFKEIELLEWLNRMRSYSQWYETLNHQRVMSDALFRDHRLHLQLPIYLNNTLLTRLLKLRLLLQDSAITHQRIFESMEPVLATSYVKLLKECPDIPTFFCTLFKKREDGFYLENYLWNEPEMISQLATIECKVEDEEEIKNYQRFEDVLFAEIKHVSFSGFSASEQTRYLYVLYSLSDALQNQLVLPDIFLEIDMLVNSYQTKGRPFLEFLKKFHSVSLRMGTPQHPQQVINMNDPLLLYEIIPLRHADLMRTIIAYGVDFDICRYSDGYTPVHFAARQGYDDMVAILTEAGALLDLTNRQQETRLDKALKYDQFQFIQLLLNGGAKRFQLPTGITFIQKHQVEQESLCQQLLRTNPALLWEFSLNEIQQIEAPKEQWRQVAYRSALSNQEIYLNETIHRQLFPTKKSEFPSHYEVQGNRKNADITFPLCGQETRLHLKENPELAGREIMVSTLARLLFGNQLTPQVGVWRFKQYHGIHRRNRTAEAYPVLASRFIEGKTLEKILRMQDREIFQRIDKESIYQGILLSMLINPEDGRAPNYMLESYERGGEAYYRLVCIDNDHAFVPPVRLLRIEGTENSSEKGIVVKTILYCLNEMNDSMPKFLQNDLLSIDPKALLTTWLKELQQEDQKIKQLFNDSERKNFKKRNIYLDIEFKESVLLDLYQKLCRLQMILKEAQEDQNSECSFMDILRHLIPSLWMRYREAHERYPEKEMATIQQRFDELTKNCFDHMTVTRPVNEEKSIALQDAEDPEEESESASISESAPIIVNQEIQVSMRSTAAASIIFLPSDLARVETRRKRETNKTPEEMIHFLEELYQSTEQLNAIQQELQQGDILRFTQLKNSDDQERIVNGFGLPTGLDFSTMKTDTGTTDIKRQQKIIKAMIGIAYKRLSLRNCESITENNLAQLLRYCPHLEALELSHTPNITGQSLVMIKYLSPNIEKLRLAHLPNMDLSRLTKPLVFERLRVLEITDCETLTTLPIEAILLDRLQITECPNFKYQELFIMYPFLLKYSKFLRDSTKKWIDQMKEEIQKQIQNNHSTTDKKYDQLSIKPVFFLKND